MAFYFYMDCETESLTLYQSECDISLWYNVGLYSVYYTASISGYRLFCMSITQFSCIKQITNPYFHTNAYYWAYDTSINDYMQLLK